MDEVGIPFPEQRTVIRTVRLRNTLLAADIKRKYDNTCQICKQRLELVEGTYAEAHHVKPIGSPHNGPDREGNIVVVCPNHHVMFDRGALKIDPHTLTISHIRRAFEPRTLYIASWHRIDRRMLSYYMSNIFGKA